MRKFMKGISFVLVLGGLGTAFNQGYALESYDYKTPADGFEVSREAKRAEQAIAEASSLSNKELTSLSQDMQPNSGRSLNSARRAYRMALALRDKGDMDKACLYARAAYDTVSGISGMKGSDMERSYAATVDELCSTKAPT